MGLGIRKVDKKHFLIRSYGMKKIQLSWLIIFISKLCICQEPETQSTGISGFYENQNRESLHQITGLYFRVNPYDREFSEFLNQLINDPAISNKTLDKRTDSTFFYFKGEYKNFSPFFFKAIRTEIILAETEIALDDSTGKSDTIMAYQLLGYSAGSNQGKEDVKQEFIKFKKKIKKKFWSIDPTEFKNGTETTGQIQNYFLPLHTVSPLTAAWGKLTASNECIFVITLRMKVKQNIAILP